MNTFTITDIRSYNPCYDPSKYLPENWRGTALDILRVYSCPPKDRLWVVLHDSWIDDKTLRLFAVWCAREALKLIDNPDPRSINACDVAERYANGEATREELAAAAYAAYATDAAAYAAYAAAYAATDAAAYAATDAAAYATDAAAYAAATAAYAAAAAAATATATAWNVTIDATWGAARDAARDVQVAYLMKMLEE